MYPYLFEGHKIFVLSCKGNSNANQDLIWFQNAFPISRVKVLVKVNSSFLVL